MKRIFLSLSMLAMVGSIAAIGSTGAFFSDTETSANNIFTAGSIDLKIDHGLSIYNGNPVGGDLTVVSDPSSTFVEDDTFGSVTGSAVNLSFVHPAWTDTTLIPGANWIWATQGPNHPADPTNDEAYIFTRTFTWSGPVVSASIDFGADNYYDVSINGNPVGSNHVLQTSNFQDPHTTNVTADIVQGTNTITFRGENQHVDGTDASSNPAGIIFKLVVHGQNNTFSNPIDLNGQTFWNFNDVKPADNGRDDFSLHVDTNDAWTCMLIGNIKNDENNVIEPETAAGDPGGGPLGDGELGKYLQLFLWNDINADGIYNPPTETPLGGGTGIFATPFVGPGTTTIALHDSTTGNGPQSGGTTGYVGSAWCAGVIAVDGSGNITCDGSAVGNDAQTDSTKADLTFFATQWRNQPNFTCASASGPCVPSDTNLVTDGGFETPPVTDTTDKWDIFTSPAGGWNVLWRDPAPVSPSPRPAVANLELHAGVLGSSFEGNQYAELDSDWDGHVNTFTGEPSATTIYQDIPTQVGASYSLSYRFAPRPNTPASDNDLESRLGGQLINDTGPVAGGGSNLVPGDWVLKGPYNFVATTTTTRISFTDLGSTNNSLGTFIDDVQLKQTSCVQ